MLDIELLRSIVIQMMSRTSVELQGQSRDLSPALRAQWDISLPLEASLGGPDCCSVPH